MHQIEFFALGTKWWLSTTDSISSTNWQQISDQSQQIVWKFNNLYSRFLETSLVGRLNKNKVIENFDLEFLQMIVLGQKVKQISGGYFDISLGNDLNRIGYDSSFNFSDGVMSFDFKSSDKNLTETKTDYPDLCDDIFKQITSSTIEIYPDFQIDLGGLGKGWLVDKLVEFFRLHSLKNFTINGGGDIFSTGGQFYLENPFDTTESIGTIELNNSAIACSSSNKRRFENDNHHLINPKTHQSQNTFVAVFTQSKNALMADIASTTLFVSPVLEHQKIAKALDVEYLLIDPDGNYFASSGYKGVLHV